LLAAAVAYRTSKILKNNVKIAW